MVMTVPVASLGVTVNVKGARMVEVTVDRASGELVVKTGDSDVWVGMLSDVFPWLSDTALVREGCNV
jgi:hypothetical protein